MEIPKDYSSVYREARAPVPATRNSGKLDGSHRPPIHREFSGIDPNQLYAKLSTISKRDREVYAIDTLQQHYNSVFQSRAKPTYRVYINYFDDKQKESLAYLVRTDKNTLREVKAKLPFKGDYRLFFKKGQNECEEVEDEDTVLPYHEKDGALNIYCRVFPR